MSPPNHASEEIDIPSLFQPFPQAIAMVDPVLKRFGRLFIAPNFVSPTKAPVVHGGLISGLPVLCAAHMKGECTEDSACLHVHADPTYIRTLRDTLLSMQTANCCLGHGHLPSCRRDFQSLISNMTVVVVKETGHEVVVAQRHIAVTAFWDQFLTKKASTSNGLLRFSVSRVCRLHQRNSCKFGPDCNNLHLCREFWSGGKAVPGPSVRKSQAQGTSTPPPQDCSLVASASPEHNGSPLKSTPCITPDLDFQKGSLDIPSFPSLPSALGFQPFIMPVAPARTMSLPAPQPPLMFQPSMRPHSLSISFPYHFQLFPQPVVTISPPTWPPSPPTAQPAPAAVSAEKPLVPAPAAAPDAAVSPPGHNLAKFRGQLTVLQLSVPNHSPVSPVPARDDIPEKAPEKAPATSPVEPLSKEEYLRVLQHWGPFHSSPATPNTAPTPASQFFSEDDDKNLLRTLDLLRRHSMPSVA